MLTALPLVIEKAKFRGKDSPSEGNIAPAHHTSPSAVLARPRRHVRRYLFLTLPSYYSRYGHP